MSDAATVHAEDMVPVYSRVSWGALLAGLFVTLTVFILLSVLGTALGLSITDNARPETVAAGAGLWALVATVLAFLSGGCVVTRCTAGESRTEAVMYGTVLWGATFALILWLSGGVLRTGFATMLGTANVLANAGVTPANWEQAARQAGVPQDQIDRMRAALSTGPDARAVSPQAAWWAFAAVLVSLLAAIAGALIGAGPSPAWRGIMFRRTTVQMGGGRP